jgi:superfamily II DNA/RNA helicase
MEDAAPFGAPLFDVCLSGRSVTKPTEIQRLVAPLLAADRQVIFRAPTGTGKTFAYLIPFLEKLDAEKRAVCARSLGGRRGPSLVICAPTHELAAQIKNEADFLIRGAALSLSVLLLAGAGNPARQIEGLKKKPSLVVGNPGRLLVLARSGKLTLQDARFLVLDEGDRLVSDELFPETEALAALFGKGVQATACSATLEPEARGRLLALFGRLVPGGSPLVVETDEQEILRDRIGHWAFFSERRRKTGTLLSFLAAVRPKKALVFSDGGGQPGIILARLRHGGIRAAGLYGGLDKKERKAAMDGFRSGKIPVLVASDLAARGLDVPDITHVIELDVPENSGAYVHRAGRTGRAGRRGVMVSIGDAEEMRALVRIEKKLGITVYPKELYGGRITAPRSD